MRRPVCAVCLVFAAAVFWLQGIGKPPLPSDGEAEGQTVTVTGKVCRKEIERSQFYGEQQVLYLKDISSVQFQNNAWKTEYTEGVLCRGAESAKTGSLVTVQGELEVFERSPVPGGFDEAQYYQTEGYSFGIRKAEVLAEGEDYDWLGEMLSYLRIRVGGIFEQTLSGKDASILKAMLLGDKKGLDRETKKLYQEAAISHILCISGLHITFLGMGLYRLCRRTLLSRLLPKSGAALLCILVMSLYGKMTGMSSSAARAIFMS